jgi:hypothetical protein
MLGIRYHSPQKRIISSIAGEVYNLPLGMGSTKSAVALTPFKAFANE